MYTYDAIGNPLTFYGNKSYTMTWTQGNRLATIKPQGYPYAQSYSYDSEGLRTHKTLVSNAGISKKINYFWTGDTLRSEWAEDGSYEIVYNYDPAGRICGFAYSQNGGTATYYRYVRNIQGDVTHILSPSGAIIAAYTYDTWGTLVSIKDGSGSDITNSTTSIGYINPIRYRGYYYDNETGLYYLQSRYYDPGTGRFLNADTQLNIQEGPLGYNLFAYCGNDPVNYADPSGHSVSVATIILICSIVAAVIATGVTVYECIETGVSIEETIFLSVGNGLAAFAFVYSLGTSLYYSYVLFCECNGISPVTEVGCSTSQSKPLPESQIDKRITEALVKLDNTNLRPGQSSISQQSVLNKLECFENDSLYITQASSSYISRGCYTIVSEGHHTTIANVIFYGQLHTGINMGQIISDNTVPMGVISWTDLIVFP